MTIFTFDAAAWSPVRLVIPVLLTSLLFVKGKYGSIRSFN